MFKIQDWFFFFYFYRVFIIFKLLYIKKKKKIALKCLKGNCPTLEKCHFKEESSFKMITNERSSRVPECSISEVPMDYQGSQPSSFGVINIITARSVTACSLNNCLFSTTSNYIVTLPFLSRPLFVCSWFHYLLSFFSLSLLRNKEQRSSCGGKQFNFVRMD